MTQYLCKWCKASVYPVFDHYEIHQFDYFNDDNGYTEANRTMLLTLKKGQRLDLSDGISFYHEIEVLT